MKDINILMIGVGGQGTVLSSDIVCDVALAGDADVKKSEIHGMAQRGGSVVSHVRIGAKVLSPVIPIGEADIVISFENMEFLRYPEYAGKNTSLVVSTHRIYPPSVAGGQEAYPAEQTEDTKKAFKEVFEIDAMKTATAIGNSKVAGMVMLGKLAALLPFDADLWRAVISKKVPPKTVDMNLAAFNAGYQF
ncbi:indolepyruvate oxidoreductase subunit beta [Geovibrio thiophilus]|uniref:Indolepyruvate oxidoreductase subunit beta n=1 Tax=Geovibrio thiophilus TaxID=139438 RepID=A0A3R6AXX6_9BACT|nr:indolepyruvate oxidoreductase subunit beta [Geovibrio thiophilus]QAR33077.1 indolepyruvate oxidoreductase subunit beta [Geovibrio thiophilus]